MPAFHKPIVILGASLSWVLAAFGCGSSSSGGDDDDPGSVLGGGAGGATGGSATSGGTGGGTSGGKGGTGTGGSGGSGNCKAAGETYEVVDSVLGGSCCEGLTTSCDITTTTDPETGIVLSNGTCTCDDGSVGGTGTGGAGGAGGAGGSTAGTGGTGGSAAGTGGSGTGGSAGTPGSGAIGLGCSSDADCASGLVCVTEAGGMLSVGSPGGGLCTLACTADAECTAITPGSWCVPFNEEQTIAYCLEGCATGAAGEPKCNGRADFACSLIGLIPGGTMCTTSDECLSTELCSTSVTPSVCGEIVTGCVPNCGGDHNCAPGDFCDFSTGLCVPDAPGGQAIGTLCDPEATTNVCNGFCIATDDAGTEGVCAAFCTFAPGLLGCGWDGSTTTPPDAACLFLTRLSPDLGVGDVGLCGALCDCNDDCQASTQRCIDDSGGEVMTIWGRAGYCRALETGETEADTIACP